MNPPANALVLSVDEKPTIQALERASGYVLTSSGKIVHGLKSTYKRHGTARSTCSLRSKWPPASFGERPRRPRNASISRPL
jgi:hypothetical protein